MAEHAAAPADRPAASAPASPHRSRSSSRAAAGTGASRRPSPTTPGKQHARGRRRTPRSASTPARPDPDTAASRVPSGAPASAACSTADSDSIVGTHDDRPTSRRPTGCPSCSSTSHLIPASPDSSAPAAQQAATQRPRSQGGRARQRPPLMSCNRTRPVARLVHFPHAGHPWPGQQWQSDPRGLARKPASEPKSSPPTGPAGDAMQPWNPCADQAPEFLT
jgi:hypothetical protein